MALHYLLMKTHNAIRKKISARAYELGFTTGQPRILECLMKQDGCEQKSIAASCDIEPATVGSVLNRMEQQGLVERRRHEGNRRSLFVYLTAKGHTAAADMQQVFSTFDALAASTLTPTEMQELEQLLQKVYLAVTGKPAERK